MNTTLWFVLLLTTSNGGGFTSGPIPGAEQCQRLLDAAVRGYAKAVEAAKSDGSAPKETIYASAQCVDVTPGKRIAFKPTAKE